MVAGCSVDEGFIEASNDTDPRGEHGATWSQPLQQPPWAWNASIQRSSGGHLELIVDSEDVLHEGHKELVLDPDVLGVGLIPGQCGPVGEGHPQAKVVALAARTKILSCIFVG